MLGPRRMLWPLTLLHICLVVLCAPQEQFDEQLSIKNLPDGKVAARFSFKTILSGASPRDPATLDNEDQCTNSFSNVIYFKEFPNIRPPTAQHYTIFPLALGQILRQYAVTELHLTLNAGNWNYDRWGYPQENGVGTGAELWAWMGDGAKQT